MNYNIYWRVTLCTCALSKELKFKVSFGQNLKTFFYCQWRNVALQNIWKCVIALCVVIQLWVYFGMSFVSFKKIKKNPMFPQIVHPKQHGSLIIYISILPSMWFVVKKF